MPKKLAQHTQTVAHWIGIFALLVASVFPLTSVQAGNLTTARDYLNRQQGGITTGIQHEIFFTTNSAVSGGAGANKVIIIFPNDANNNTLWCRTASTLTVTAITDPTGTGATETASTAGGTLAGSCTQTPDTLTITGLNNLSATTKYGLRITGLGAVLGTGTASVNDAVTVKTNNGTSDIDTQTIAMYTIASDQVSVTATVNPSLSVTLSGTTAALGTLDASHVNQAGITSEVTTNAANGYISLVSYSGALSAGGGVTLADAAGATLAVGAEGFGASTSKASQTLAQWSPTVCDTTTSTSGITALSTTFKSFAAAAAPVSADSTTLCFMAGVSGTTKAGSYSTTATVVTTARY